jgi:hypothetical protein
MPPLLTQYWKNCQPKSPQNANTGYATPWEGIPASLPKKTEKMSTATSGWITTHATPRTVCL